VDTVLNEIDRYLEGIIDPWKAVGLVVGIVKDKQVIFKKSYGYRTFCTEPMNTETLFAIGSASKAFTSAAIAILIRQGKIKGWNDKVKTYLPDYEASDKYAQNHMSIRDLLCMRSGYSPRGYDNMLFHGSHYTMDEIISLSRYIPFEIEFRDRMRYDNLNYMLAGKIVEVVSGMSWHEFIEKEIFEKVGMSHSGTTYDYSLRSENMASPHLYFNGKIHQVKLRNIDNAAPAGSILSNIDDMLQWVKFQLSDGEFNGYQFTNPEDMRMMHKPHNVIDTELFKSHGFEDVYVPAYGLGWFVYELNGLKVIGHGGHIDGFSSWVHLIPEFDAGIVILNNSDHNDLSQPILRTISDLLFQKEKQYDYSQYFLEQYLKERDAYDAEFNHLMALLEGKELPSSELAKYCGEYTHQIFGTQKIELKDGRLKVERFDWKGELRHLEDHTFVADWGDDLAHPPVKFAFRCEGDSPVSVDVDMFGVFERNG